MAVLHSHVSDPTASGILTVLKYQLYELIDRYFFIILVFLEGRYTFSRLSGNRVSKDILTLHLLFLFRVSMVEFVLRVYVRNLRPQVPEFENVFSVPSGAD